jgi:hypothetical protein
MNDSATQTAAASQPLSTSENITGNRSFIQISFAAIIIFFFFGFVDFKCNGTTATSLTGYNLVFGTHLKNPINNAFNQSQNVFDQFNVNEDNEQIAALNGDKIESNVWAIIALSSAIIGVIVLLKKRKMEASAGLLFAITGFISLIVLQAVIKNKVEAQQGNSMFVIETDFQFGYWVSLLAFIIAGIMSFLQIKLGKKEIKGNLESNISKLNVFISSSLSNTKEPGKE